VVEIFAYRNLRLAPYLNLCGGVILCNKR